VPGDKRSVPLEPRKVSPEEWEALGLPRSVLVVSPQSGKPSETQPPSGTGPTATGPKPPAPSSEDT
jgi:hypothetical protein